MITKINPQSRFHVNPRFRAYGKARIDIAKRAQTREDWMRLWKEPTNPFPFTWGEWWKQCIEYKVDDFAAEVGFFIDILGLPVNAFDPGYAMFTSPFGEFYFAVVPTHTGEQSTPSDAIRIQFMVADILEAADQLQRRGIVFDQSPHPCEEGSSLYIGYFHTPHGICVDLWGVVEPGDYDINDYDEELEMPMEENLDEDINDDGIEPDLQSTESTSKVSPEVEVGHLSNDEYVDDVQYVSEDEEIIPWKVRYS